MTDRILKMAILFGAMFNLKHLFFIFLNELFYSIRHAQPAAPICLAEARQSEDGSLSDRGPASTKPSP